MRLAMPIKENKAEKSIVAEQFETSSLFAFIEITDETYHIEVLEKSEEDYINYLIKNNANLLIASKINPETCKKLSKNQIKVFYDAEGTIDEIVQQFIAMVTSQMQGSCNGCSGCSSESDNCNCSSENDCNCNNN